MRIKIFHEVGREVSVAPQMESQINEYLRDNFEEDEDPEILMDTAFSRGQFAMTVIVKGA